MYRIPAMLALFLLISCEENQIQVRRDTYKQSRIITLSAVYASKYDDLAPPIPSLSVDYMKEQKADRSIIVTAKLTVSCRATADLKPEGFIRVGNLAYPVTINNPNRATIVDTCSTPIVNYAGKDTRGHYHTTSCTNYKCSGTVVMPLNAWADMVKGTFTTASDVTFRIYVDAHSYDFPLTGEQWLRLKNFDSI